MKKVFSFFFVLTLFAGCGKHNGSNPLGVIESDISFNNGNGTQINTVSGNNGNNSIVFAWKDDFEITLTYSDDGTYTYIYEDGDYCWTEKGTYTIIGNSVIATDSDGYSYTETFTIIGNKLVLIDEDGYSQSYTKI